MSFIDSLLAGLSLVGNIESFLALAVGVAIGVVGGAIPGMSATMAVALTLPFTFAMQPITGILLLLGVYKGGIFGGSIPAILIKTPGTPASSATVLDGYPLAEQGKAGKALGMSPERLKSSLQQVFTYGNIWTSLVGGGTKILLDDLTNLYL